ncbi:hypothetical protein DC20_01985 [Rufibacter tibetensis]|uniref:Uncharacterized protein n=2 Tax=Rufibacter tibetensis TaxID=512763 RepID=A0A0P0BZP6_9BACT|nr:hypothetical protein DC20_01985 [Rufibacter tibetensis]
MDYSESLLRYSSVLDRFWIKQTRIKAQNMAQKIKKFIKLNSSSSLHLSIVALKNKLCRMRSAYFKSLLLVAAVVLSGASALAQPVFTSEPALTGSTPLLTSSEGAQTSSEDALATLPSPEIEDGSKQDKPRKAKDKKGSDQSDKEKNEIKEVATAKRQDKPEKVSSAGRPQSAARPGRGAASSAVKAAGNVTKAVKATKPIKVGGVGVGRIKVGKN